MVCYHSLCNFFLESFFFLFHFFNLFLEWVNQRQIVQCDVIIIIFYVTLFGCTLTILPVILLQALELCNLLPKWFFVIFHQGMNLTVFSLFNFVNFGAASQFENFALLFHFFLEFLNNFIWTPFKVLSQIRNPEKGFVNFGKIYGENLLHVLLFDKLLDLILMRQL